MDLLLHHHHHQPIITNRGELMIMDNEPYQNFINTLKSEYTKKTYRKSLRNFLSFLNIQDYDCSKLLEYDIKTIENHIRDYILDMRTKRNLSPASIDCHCAALKHFFDINDVDLRWSKKLIKFKGSKDDYYYNNNNNNNNKKNKKTRNEIRAYTLEEIQKLFNSAQDQRTKIMIALMASSGIRIGTFLSLRIRNLIPIDKYGIYQIIVYENTSSQHYTFCSQECRKEIDNYLGYRKRNGEIMRPESPLIREQFNTRNRVGSAKPRFLSDRGLTKMIEHVINVDAAIKYNNNNNINQNNNDEEEEDNTISTTTTQTHSFRRFFETTAIKEGISPLYVNMLMNHDIGLEKSYFKPTVNDLLEGSDKMPGYIQIMNAVTINEENRLSKQVHELKEKDDYQNYVIDKKIKEKDEEIVKMRQAMRTVFDMMANQKDNIKELNDRFKSVTSSLFEMKMFTIKLDEVDQKKQEMYATKGFVTKEDEEAIKNSIAEDVKQNDPDLWHMLFDEKQQQHQEREQRQQRQQ
jgi:site-specific recombinase XerD